MTEAFWFMVDDPEGDAGPSGDAPVPYETSGAFAPYQEPMRGDRRGPRRAPSTDQKRIRRQIHRSGAHALEEVDWNEYHPHLEGMAENGELHRGIGVNLPDDLHRFVHDESKPVHERAKALLDHVAGMRNDPGDRRVGLGMHWSLTGGVAEDFGEKAAGHYAGTNAGKQDQHDFSWGRTSGEPPDYEMISDHLHEDHGIHPHDQLDPDSLHELHVHLHGHRPVPKGQGELFDASPHVDPERVRHRQELEPQAEPDYAHGKPGTAVVLRTSIPDVDDIETHIHGNPHAGGDVYHPEGHGEMEVPIRHGASIPITGISWKPVHDYGQEPDDEPDYVHHRFDEPEHREAVKKDAAWDTSNWRIHRLGELHEAMPKRDGAHPENFRHHIVTMGPSVARKGWTHKRLYGFLEGENDDGAVGHINFHVNPHGTALAVEDMETYADDRRSFRARGVASAMQDAMVKAHPNHFIDHGMRTPAGHAWWSKYEDPAPDRNIENLHENLWGEHFDPEIKRPQSYPAPTEEDEARAQARMDELYKQRPAEGEKTVAAFALHLPRDVHSRLIDESVSTADRAAELMQHVKKEPLHWTYGGVDRYGASAFTAAGMHRQKGEPVIHGVVRGVTPPGTTQWHTRNKYQGLEGKMPIHSVKWQESVENGGYYNNPNYMHSFGEDVKHTATVLPTSVERLNTGDTIRTPTGQTAEVRKVRPHETDSRLVYLDTDQGTSTVSRGTDMQVVPRNSQQQELPDSGNLMGGGNAGALPGQGSGPGGMEAQDQQIQSQPCPNCGQSSLNLRGGMYMCNTCGFQIQSGNTPGNLLFGERPQGYMPGRRQPGETPMARMWASRYTTGNDSSQIARRARQVLGGDQ